MTRGTAAVRAQGSGIHVERVAPSHWFPGLVAKRVTAQLLASNSRELVVRVVAPDELTLAESIVVRVRMKHADVYAQAIECTRLDGREADWILRVLTSPASAHRQISSDDARSISDAGFRANEDALITALQTGLPGDISHPGPDIYAAFLERLREVPEAAVCMTNLLLDQHLTDTERSERFFELRRCLESRDLDQALYELAQQFPLRCCTGQWTSPQLPASYRERGRGCEILLTRFVDVKVAHRWHRPSPHTTLDEFKRLLRQITRGERHVAVLAGQLRGKTGACWGSPSIPAWTDGEPLKFEDASRAMMRLGLVPASFALAEGILGFQYVCPGRVWKPTSRHGTSPLFRIADASREAGLARNLETGQPLLEEVVTEPVSFDSVRAVRYWEQP